MARRAEFGTDAVNRRFLSAAGTEVFCVDIGPDALRSLRWAGRDDARRVYRFSDDV
ncbi:hypothetical protein [Streptomyces sp. TRM70350]|uniref:hypothetical protein n=1 Tax=Streptomyces sp. TRM70350 TaxID=2856165 RepID=UPI001C45768D|nr:hypothetical protein [Streptomyces sp. TRM70350]MBV7694418.1 hypothetical protein [Streptomyces sp. TRM70350]